MFMGLLGFFWQIKKDFGMPLLLYMDQVQLFSYMLSSHKVPQTNKIDLTGCQVLGIFLLLEQATFTKGVCWDHYHSSTVNQQKAGVF